MKKQILEQRIQKRYASSMMSRDKIQHKVKFICGFPSVSIFDNVKVTKNREQNKMNFHFLCRDRVTYLKIRKFRLSE